jgi:hypothetical protein
MDSGADVARQLVDSFDDALEHGDADARDYAVEQLDDFIDEIDDDSDDEVLVALLDLLPDPTSRPLLDQVARKLTRRGPGVVESLLGAVLGDAPPELRLSDIISVAGAVGALLEAATRNPNVPPRAGNAIAILDAMALGDLVLGLVAVLEGRADERAKQAASEMLVDIGEPAVECLKVSLRDRDAAPWVVDTLVDLRDGRKAAQDAVGAADDPSAGGDTDDRVGGGFDGLGDGFAELGAAGDGPGAEPSAPAAPTGTPATGVAPAPSAAPPVGDDIDREFAAFLDKFKRETGQS